MFVRLLPALLCCFMAIRVQAQDHSQHLQFSCPLQSVAGAEGQWWQSGVIAAHFQRQPAPFTAVYLHFPATGAEAAAPRLRTSTDGQRWTDWQPMRIDEHVSDADTLGTVPFFADADARFFQVALRGGGVRNARLLLFDPAMPVAPLPARAEPTVAAADRSVCECPKPPIQPRSAWNAPELPSTCQVATTVTHLIVHHSATSNTSPNWAATVRAIYNGHRDRAFCDVGYNYLIDPNGEIYEGRVNGDFINIAAAHFCSRNAGTMGVCMMGDYTNIPPTAAARNSLVRLLSWRACGLNLDPTAVALHTSSALELTNISGHRDGCATECPGNTLYPLLPAIRQSVRACVFPDGVLSTTEADASALRIVPNPNQGVFMLEWPTAADGAAHIRIWNALGQCVYTAPAGRYATAEKVEIRLPASTKGLLTVQVMQGRHLLTQKFVVE
jgi:N-acetylmuramoyl-L-alanine amidase